MTSQNSLIEQGIEVCMVPSADRVSLLISTTTFFNEN
jgi:hypothetical protein